MTDIVLLTLLLLPAVITYFFKSNAALGFLSLTAGMALSTYATTDVQRLINQLGFWSSYDNISLVLTVAPLILTLILARGAGKGLPQILQLATALCTGYLLVLAVMPALGSNGVLDISESNLWVNIQKIQSYVVGAGVILSLVLVWFGSGKHSKKH